MAYELGEQLDWTFPDWIIYPTGGGTGMVGMWKAFEEMEAIGWKPSGRRPKMVSVQAEHCAPIVRAFEQGAERSEMFPNARTVADGLRVPKAIGDFLVLRAVRESGGTALAVSDADMVARDARARREGRHQRRAGRRRGAARRSRSSLARGDVKRVRHGRRLQYRRRAEVPRRAGVAWACAGCVRVRGLRDIPAAEMMNKLLYAALALGSVVAIRADLPLAAAVTPVKVAWSRPRRRSCT